MPSIRYLEKALLWFALVVRTCIVGTPAPPPSAFRFSSQCSLSYQINLKIGPLKTVADTTVQVVFVIGSDSKSPIWAQFIIIHHLHPIRVTILDCVLARESKIVTLMVVWMMDDDDQ